MVLEYLTGNELKKYPFDDLANTTSTLGFVFSADMVLDILFAVNTQIGVPGYAVHLLRFEIDNAEQEVRFTFGITDGDGNSLPPYSFTGIIPFVDIDDRRLCSAYDGNSRLKLVSGPGLKTLVDAAQDIDETFNAGTLKLAASAVIQPVPQVSSISFYNQATLVTTFTGSNSEEVDVTLREGSNLNFLDISDTGSLAVIPGAGTGLYNPCGLNDGLKSINGVPPDNHNNFIFDTDGCYVTTKNISNHGLEFDNVCTPKCTKEQLAGFANYLNRVNDGLSSLSAIAASTANQLKESIADYITDVVPIKNKPYIKVSFSKYKGPGTSYYYSVSVGFFNPSDSTITMSMTITHPGTLLSDTCKYLKDDRVTILTSPTSGDGSVPCHSYARTEFVFAGVATDPGNVVVTGTFAGHATTVTKVIH